MNPYEPPSAVVTDPPQALGSPVKAVLLGVVVDIAGTLVFNFAVGIVFMSILMSRGMNLAEAKIAIDVAMNKPWVTAVMMTIGFGFSSLGGYVCARVSRRSTYQLGWILSAIMGVFGVILGGSSYSVTEHVLMFACAVGAVLLGTRLGMPKRQPYQPAE